MGGFLSTFSKLIWSKKEIRILILGLDNAGKTTLLYRLKIGEVVTTIPTIGFNVESVTYKNLNFNVWDLGGQTSIRPYWRCYYANTAAVVFVIDSTDIERLDTAAGELRAMLDEDELRDAALLVFANKQDQPGAKGAGDISEALRLGELKDRNWSIMACSAIDGRGVNEGMDWLVVSISAGGGGRGVCADVWTANRGREPMIPGMRAILCILCMALGAWVHLHCLGFAAREMCILPLEDVSKRMLADYHQPYTASRPSSKPHHPFCLPSDPCHSVAGASNSVSDA